MALMEILQVLPIVPTYQILLRVVVGEPALPDQMGFPEDPVVEPVEVNEDHLVAPAILVTILLQKGTMEEAVVHQVVLTIAVEVVGEVAE
jgi:hypothetical protein